MDQVTRFIKVRTSDGNDHVYEYKVERPTSVEEALQEIGESFVLDSIRFCLERQARDAARWHFTNKMRNQ